MSVHCLTHLSSRQSLTICSLIEMFITKQEHMYVHCSINNQINKHVFVSIKKVNLFHNYARMILFRETIHNIEEMTNHKRGVLLPPGTNKFFKYLSKELTSECLSLLLMTIRVFDLPLLMTIMILDLPLLMTIRVRDLPLLMTIRLLDLPLIMIIRVLDLTLLKMTIWVLNLPFLIMTIWVIDLPLLIMIIWVLDIPLLMTEFLTYLS